MPDVLEPGEKVEVRRRFDAQWARGFEVIDVNESGVRIRRLSDGDELPVRFAPDEVRKESKRNSMWWM